MIQRGIAMVMVPIAAGSIIFPGVWTIISTTISTGISDGLDEVNAGMLQVESMEESPMFPASWLSVEPRLSAGSAVGNGSITALTE